jgi:hypothetical protein
MDQWPAAKELGDDLKSLARCVESRSANTFRGSGYMPCIAELLDIQHDIGTKKDVVNKEIRSLSARGGHAIPEPVPVDNFIKELRNCDPAVHTRIVVLNSGRIFADDRAADDLFLCHVLGVELDLPPTDVRSLAQMEDRHQGQRPHSTNISHRSLLKPGFISLFTSDFRERNISAYLGRRKMGNGSPHVGGRN